MAQQSNAAVRREDWDAFSGLMALIGGTLNVFYGIAAIDNSSFYIQGADYAISGLDAWGWTHLILGAILLLASLAILSGGFEPARWAAVFAATLNSMTQVLALPAYPFLSLVLFTVDVLIIYGLVVRSGAASRA
mgnify:CR=1 FL=1